MGGINHGFFEPKHQSYYPRLSTYIFAALGTFSIFNYTIKVFTKGRTANILTIASYIQLIAFILAAPFTNNFLLVIGNYAPSEFMQHMIVFALACFVGFQVIWNVSHALHTPLMAVTNAISGIIIIGAVLQMTSESWIAIFLAAISVLISTINIVGGFLVTRRMLAMFQKS